MKLEEKKLSAVQYIYSYTKVRWEEGKREKWPGERPYKISSFDTM